MHCPGFAPSIITPPPPPPPPPPPYQDQRYPSCTRQASEATRPANCNSACPSMGTGGRGLWAALGGDAAQRQCANRTGPWVTHQVHAPRTGNTAPHHTTPRQLKTSGQSPRNVNVRSKAGAPRSNAATPFPATYNSRTKKPLAQG